MIRPMANLAITASVVSFVASPLPVHARTLYTAEIIEGAGYAYDINDAGQVVGKLGFDGHAYLWDPEQGTLDLGTFGGEASVARGINKFGQVVGTAKEKLTIEHVYDYLNRSKPFLWSSGRGMVELTLTTPWWYVPTVHAINDQEQIVVSLKETEWDWLRIYSYIWRPANGVINASQLSCNPGDTEHSYTTDAIAINNSGQVAGQCRIRVVDESYVHAIFGTVEEGMIDLGTLGGENSYAAGLNDSAQVVGYSQVDQRVSHAFLWDAAHGMRDLGTLGGDRSKAHDINNSGQVVGVSEYAYLGDYRAFLWEEASGMVDLNTLVINPPEPVKLVEALEINNVGQIVARGISRGKLRLYLLTPVQHQFAKFEAGEVTLDHHWVRVPFFHYFSHPVVIAQLTSKFGDQPCVLRIKDVDQYGFTIRIQEYEYLDGFHTAEEVSYLIMEEGIHHLADGGLIQAGTFETNATSTSVPHPLAGEFDRTPVIMTSITTTNGHHAVTGRIDTVSQSGFNYRMQEQENSQDNQRHLPETIAYLAWEQGCGKDSNIHYKARRLKQPVTHRPKFILQCNTQQQDLPFVLTEMQTTNDPDTSSLSRLASPTEYSVFIDEETSLDRETRHRGEIVGYIVLTGEANHCSLTDGTRRHSRGDASLPSRSINKFHFNGGKR